MVTTIPATPLALVFAGLVGLVMGSFLNCLAWRWVNGESVLHGRSHCTSCGHVLGPLDLIPVLSWVASRGRCRHCGTHVSARYPATELLCCLMYVTITWRYGISVETLELIAFASVLLVLSLTDLDSYIIPNATIVACVSIRAAYLAYLFVSGQPDAQAILVESLIGAVAVGIPLVVLVLIMDRVLGRESMGGGDLKLYAVAGLYFGWQCSILLILVSCILGIVLAYAGPRPDDQARQDDTDDAEPDASGPDDNAPAEDNQAPSAPEGSPATSRSTQPFPFGPAIAAACWLTMLFGREVLAWYLGLF